MRYLLIFSLLFVSCNDIITEEEIIEEPVGYTLELRYSGDRLIFNQIALPNNVFEVSSGNQSFSVLGLNDTDDVRLTLTFGCTAGGSTYTEEVLVNFYDDLKTVLLIERVVTCNPEVQVIYE